MESWPTPENGSISETFDSDVASNAAETNVAELCGARFCPGVSADDVANLQPPHPHKIQLLAAVFLALMLAAVGLVAFFADSLKRYEMGRKGAGSGLSGLRLLAVTVRHLMQWKQLLLVPITMFIGAEQAFIAVDFTAVSVGAAIWAHLYCIYPYIRYNWLVWDWHKWVQNRCRIRLGDWN